MAEDLADDRERHSGHQCVAGRGVAEVVEAYVLKARDLAAHTFAPGRCQRHRSHGGAAL